MQPNKDSKKMRPARHHIVIGLVVIAGAASWLGCGQPQNMGGGPTGTVRVALEAVGSDGATYQFLPGSDFSVSTGATFDFGLELDGTDTVLTKTLPIGDYNAILFFPGDGSPRLIRTVNGIPQTVQAILADSQPFTFSVVQDMTTPLVLHFSVAGLGDVTFETGSLRLSIDVTPSSTTTASHGKVSATFTETDQSIVTGFGLEASLGLVAGETDSVSLSFSLTSSFAPRGLGKACATIAVDSETSPSSSVAFSALAEEGGVAGTEGELCLYDVGADDSIEFHFVRKGTAPADQQAFFPGSNYQFDTFLGFSYVGDIVDGATLRLSQLGTPIALGSAGLLQSIFDADRKQSLEFCSGDLAGTFQLAP